VSATRRAVPHSACPAAPGGPARSAEPGGRGQALHYIDMSQDCPTLFEIELGQARAPAPRHRAFREGGPGVGSAVRAADDVRGGRQVDRGGTLGWVSQFPTEAEFLLPPLSNLEVLPAQPPRRACRAARLPARQGGRASV